MSFKNSEHYPVDSNTTKCIHISVPFLLSTDS